jgi:hypothetical protein
MWGTVPLLDLALLSSGAGSGAGPMLSGLTLRWVLEVFPARQPAGMGRTLLRRSRNAIVVADVMDVESDTYVTPDTVSWQLLEGSDVAVSGSLTASSDRWRGEIILDPAFALGPGPVLVVTATKNGASWVREYPITVSVQE